VNTDRYDSIIDFAAASAKVVSEPVAHDWQREGTVLLGKGLALVLRGAQRLALGRIRRKGIH
jgi:hypothetical protein